MIASPDFVPFNYASGLTSLRAKVWFYMKMNGNLTVL